MPQSGADRAQAAQPRAAPAGGSWERELTLPRPVTKGPVLCWPLLLAEMGNITDATLGLSAKANNTPEGRSWACTYSLKLLLHLQDGLLQAASVLHCFQHIPLGPRRFLH